MAIPPNLIKKIHEGDARYRTYVWGYSSSGMLPVANDTYIIIIAFKFWHFIDLFTDDLDDINEVWLRSVKQIRFSSLKSNNHFIIRQPIRSISSFDGFEFIFDTWGHTEYKDIYLVHDQDVSIAVVNSPSEEAIATLSAVAPPATGKDRSPSGFGTDASTDNVAAIIDFALGDGIAVNSMETVPLSRTFTDPALGIPLASSEVQYPITPDGAPQIIEQGFGRMSRLVPLVEISYIEILEEPDEKLKASL